MTEDEYFRTLAAAVGSLMVRKEHIQQATNLRPIGAVLPVTLRPEDQDPADPATILGLPVTWGDRLSLIYAVDGNA